MRCKFKQDRLSLCVAVQRRTTKIEEVQSALTRQLSIGMYDVRLLYDGKRLIQHETLVGCPDASCFQ